MFSLIPHPLRVVEPVFLLVASRDKKPIDKKWSSNQFAHYQWNDPYLNKHLRAGGNVGFLCNQGYLVVDSDNSKFSKFLVNNFDTYIEKSGSSARTFFEVKAFKVHAFFRVGCESPSKVVLEKGGIHYGEVQGKNTQVVCTPSIHPCGLAYHPIKNKPIATIDYEELISKVCEFCEIELGQNSAQVGRISEEAKKRLRERYSLNVCEIAKDLNIREVHSGVWQGELGCHESVGKNHFRLNVEKNCWVCYTHCHEGRFSGGGPLHLIAVKHDIIACEDLCKQRNKLTESQFNRSLTIGREKYGLILPKKNNYLWRSLTWQELEKI